MNSIAHPSHSPTQEDQHYDGKMIQRCPETGVPVVFSIVRNRVHRGQRWMGRIDDHRDASGVRFC